MMRISAYIEQGASASEDEKRAADFLEVILNDRADELLQWARLEMNAMSAALITSIKGKIA